MKALRIIKYGEVHEDATSRKFINLNYIQFPVRRESMGWQMLGMMPGGFEAKGVYTDLTEFAARCPVRGVFASEVRPYSVMEIAALTRIPADILTRAMDLFRDDQIGFIDEIDWPIDPRLIEENEVQKRGKQYAASRVIRSFWLAPDGGLHDPEGNLIAPNTDWPADGAGQTPVGPKTFEDGACQTGIGTRHETQRERERERETNGNRINREREPDPSAAGAPADNPESPRGDPEKSPPSGIPDPDPGPPAADFDTERQRAYQRWLLAVTPLLGREHGAKAPSHSSRAASDRGQADSTFALAWPELESEAPALEVCRARVAEFTKLVDLARPKKKPMAYLRGCANKRAAKWAETAVTR